MKGPALETRSALPASNASAGCVRRREQEVVALDMEEQLAARRRMAAELQAQLQSRAETMAVRLLRGHRTQACLKP